MWLRAPPARSAAARALRLRTPWRTPGRASPSAPVSPRPLLSPYAHWPALLPPHVTDLAPCGFGGGEAPSRRGGETSRAWGGNAGTGAYGFGRARAEQGRGGAAHPDPHELHVSIFPNDLRMMMMLRYRQYGTARQCAWALNGHPHLGGGSGRRRRDPPSRVPCAPPDAHPSPHPLAPSLYDACCGRSNASYWSYPDFLP